MNDPDILSLIIKNRTLKENITVCCISKLFNEICNLVVVDQLTLFYYLRRFKRRTVFPKKKRTFRSYYTLKNMYINKEERPILNFG
jgi:hypothetical protein